MAFTYSDPFDALFTLQRALDSRLASDWLGASTAGAGDFPPINVFQKGDDFVAVAGVDKKDLQNCRARSAERWHDFRPLRREIDRVRERAGACAA